MSDAFKGAGIIAVFLIGIWIILSLVHNLPTLLPPQTNQNTVLVNGTITTGFGTSPYNITFTSQGTGQQYFASINTKSQYSVSLLGSDTYNFTIYYNGAFGKGTSSNCQGTLYLNNSVRALTFNKNC